MAFDSSSVLCHDPSFIREKNRLNLDKISLSVFINWRDCYFKVED